MERIHDGLQRRVVTKGADWVQAEPTAGRCHFGSTTQSMIQPGWAIRSAVTAGKRMENVTHGAKTDHEQAIL